MTTLLRGLGLVLGGLMLLVGGFVALVTFVRNPTLSGEEDLAATIVLTIGAMLGGLLVRLSSPGAFAKVPSLLARGWRALLRPSALVHPAGIGVWTLLIVTLLMIPPVTLRFRLAFYGFVAYLFWAAGALLVSQRWWVGAIQTLAISLVVMFGLIFVSEAFERDSIGQGGLALLGPLMASWVVIPLTWLVNLFVRRSPSPPSAAGT
jgi:hypothetical protein